jgi:hypothetical protein
MSFEVIPGTPGWTISENGDLKDPEGNYRKTYTNGDGYVTAAVQVIKDNKKCWRTFGLHRLVALAHIPCEGYPDEYHVNHRDLDKTNNNVSNLEWLTPRENNIHAALFSGTPERPAIVARNLNEDEFFYINTIGEAAEMFQLTELEIWDIVRTKSAVSGYTLEANVRGCHKPPGLNKPNFRDRDPFGRPKEVPVAIKNIETGVVVGYKSINDAARDHEVSASHIHQCIIKDKPKLFKRNFLIIPDGGDFPELTDDEIENLRYPTGKEVWAYKLDDELITVWSSASSFIKECKLSKKAVTTRLAKGRIEEVGGWIFVYSKNGGYRALKEFMDSPQAMNFKKNDS